MGYIENVFFSQVKADKAKKEIFNKSTSIKILLPMEGSKQIALRHKFRSAIFYLRDQFLLIDRISKGISLESNILFTY